MFNSQNFIVDEMTTKELLIATDTAFTKHRKTFFEIYLLPLCQIKKSTKTTSRNSGTTKFIEIGHQL